MIGWKIVTFVLQWTAKFELHINDMTPWIMTVTHPKYDTNVFIFMSSMLFLWRLQLNLENKKQQQ